MSPNNVSKNPSSPNQVNDSYNSVSPLISLPIFFPSSNPAIPANIASHNPVAMVAPATPIPDDINTLKSNVFNAPSDEPNGNNIELRLKPARPFLISSLIPFLIAALIVFPNFLKAYSPTIVITVSGSIVVRKSLNPSNMVSHSSLSKNPFSVCQNPSTHLFNVSANALKSKFSKKLFIASARFTPN